MPYLSIAALVPTERIADAVADRLVSAADDRTHPMRVTTMATAGLDGRITARIMVLRGAEERFARLWFHTDVRATKVAELRADPSTCIVAYDPRDGVQIRLHGRAVIHGDDDVAARHWQQLDLAARHLYQTEGTPGVPHAEPDPRARAAIERIETQADPERARRRFAVIEVTVDSIDWLQSTTHGMQRAMLTRDGGWVPVAVAP